MTDGQPSAFLRPLLDALPADARILDAGGWLQPLLCATHVADMMPYQTRRGRLQTEPVAGERFTAATWMRVDFLSADLRLPVPDKFFHFAYCSQTIEDLADPAPLLRELNRVARSGVIESPSRLAEQTIGIRDRMTGSTGHPHHHWILDPTRERLELCPKSALASLSRTSHAVPLLSFERCARTFADVHDDRFVWQNELRWTLVDDLEARRRACAYREAVRVTPLELLLDAPIRFLRRIKSRLLGRPRDNPAAWFQQMLALSAPFMTPPPKPQ